MPKIVVLKKELKVDWSTPLIVKKKQVKKI
jgi:hypothetical protein